MRGDPAAPPPGVAIWIRTIAALDLPTELGPPERALPAPVWRAVHGEAVRRRLVGRLARAIADGTWPATDEQGEQAATSHRRLCARDLLIERELLGTVGRLTDHGIRPLVLKGPALARLVHHTPADRSFRDVDLLVPADRIDDAVEVLVAAGAHRHFPEPRPGFDAHFSKGAAFTAASGYEIDLHRSLALAPYGLLIDPATVFARATSIDVGPVRLDCPDPTALAAHAAVHAVLGDPWPRWENLRDVALTIGHPDVELAELVELVTTWQAGSVLAYAIGATWTELALDRQRPAYRWMAEQHLDRTDAHRLRAYLGEHRDHARGAVAGARAIPDWRDRARYLRGIALPDDALRSHAQRWRRGWRALRGER